MANIFVTLGGSPIGTLAAVRNLNTYQKQNRTLAYEVRKSEKITRTYSVIAYAM
jgi:hypothetical protein